MDTIREWWGAIMAATGLGVWLVRLEGSSKTALRELARLEKQMETDRRSASENRQEQNEMLREMRADIKRILERGGPRAPRPPSFDLPQTTSRPAPCGASSFWRSPMPTLTYRHWHDVPANAWRWPNFSAAEIACRGTGAIRINTEAMDKLQALRDHLGKPLIVRSAYRSPEHNRAVGGAPASKHMQGTAFDIAMVNHDPVAFEAAARAVGFLGFGYYPRSGFMHIDLGPARSWGDPFPARPVPFAQDLPPAREVLSESRTLRGGGAAGAATVGAAGVEVLQDVLAETQSTIQPLVPYLDTLRWVLIAIALIGIAVTIHARLDDWKRGQR